MTTASPAEATENLVAALHRLGVRHLGRLGPASGAPMAPAHLLRALAEHPEARLRSALLLVFLRHPSLAPLARGLAAELGDEAANTLKLYYQAAVYLQPELEPVLRARLPGWAPLPDLFGGELGLPAPETVSVEAGLQAVGAAHRRLSGRAYNWAGSYRQHVRLFVRQLDAPDEPHHH